MPNPIIGTGSADWSSGVDSLKTATIQSPDNPNGLTASQLAWASNCTMRSGSLEPRDGWTFRGAFLTAQLFPNLIGQIFQGASIYIPASGNPYYLIVIGGHVLRVDPDFLSPPQDLSASFNLFFPAPLAPRVYFVNHQAGAYQVIQSGDYDPATGNGTLPLFWDGTTLSRSNGITGVIQRGLVGPTTYTFPNNAFFKVASVGNTFQLESIYPGNVYDKIHLIIASGNASGTDIGTFEVVLQTGDTTTLRTLTTAVSGTTYSSADALSLQAILEVGGAPVVYNAASTVGTGATQSINIQPTNFQAVTHTTGNLGYPSFGVQRQIFFTNTHYIYPGGVGDIIYAWNNAGTAEGTFIVTEIETGNITLKGLAPLHPNTAVEPTLKWLVTQTAGEVGVLLVPPAGQTVTVPFNVSNLDAYIGSIGDTITGDDGSTYMVTGYNTPSSWQYGVGVVLKAIAPINEGSIFPFSWTLTITSTPSQTGSNNLNQIPAAGPMEYYQGRIWFATGPTINYGDIVGAASGTPANQFLDSVLYATETPWIFGGGGFRMPSGNDNITGLAIPQMINASLGQGLLNIGTANGVFALQVPPDQASWNSITATNGPQIFVIQLSNGFSNDIGVVSINGDLWFRSFLPDIRSLITAVRYFQQYANPSLSSNEDFITSRENAELMNFCSGIYFNNRLLMTALPEQTPYGVIHPAMIPLDMTGISTLEQQDPPDWEGSYEGLQILKLDTNLWGTLQRAFAVVLSPSNPGQMEIWEIGNSQSVFDIGPISTNRIKWQATFPGFTWDTFHDLKELVSGELFIDELQGVADIFVEYSPDGSSCWYPWTRFLVCSAQDSTQLSNPNSYPVVKFQPGIRRPLVFPKPPLNCEGQTSRASNIAFEIQPRITVIGQCRIRAMRLFATLRERSLYEGMIGC